VVLVIELGKFIKFVWQHQAWENRRPNRLHPSIDFSSSTEQSTKVPRTMHHSQNVNSVRERSIKDQEVFETDDPKNSQGLERSVPEP
jgi:hypothetical protein